jgi:hypothetical protein
LLALTSVSTVGDCEIVVVALSTFAGTLRARLGLMLSSAVRTVIAACADDTLTRFSSVKRKIWSWARTAKSRTASSTGGVAMAWETASATIGRAADTKFDVRASRSVA